MKIIKHGSLWNSVRPVLAIAALLRLAAILAVHNWRNPEMWEFGIIARNLVSGRGFWLKTLGGVPVPSAFMPPAYEYFLAAMFTMFGDRTSTYFLIQLLQAASGVLLVYLIFSSAQLLFGERVALVAAWLAALYPPFIYMCAEMHPIGFYTPLGLAVVFYLYRFLEKEGGLRDLLLSSALLGALLMFRAEALALIFMFSAIVFFRSADGRKLRNAAAFFVLPVICLVPWTVRNYRVFHRWVPITTAGGLNLWYGHNPDATGSQRHPWPDGTVVQPRPELTRLILQIPGDAQYEIALDQLYRRQALDFFRTHHAWELHLMANKILYFWVFDLNHPKARNPLYWGPSVVLVLLWVFAAWRHRRGALGQHLLFTSSILLAMTVCLALFVLPRYRMVVEPLMIPFAAEALLWAYRKIAGMEDGRSRLQTSLSSKSSAMADPALTAVAVPSDKD
jgi:4-amino-4-deoxy-L-arabinose transferase-like glycosyltransferase